MVTALLGGCQLVFPQEDVSDIPSGPCTPGELAVVPGAWESGAVDGDGVMYVGYRDAETKLLFVQAIDERGALAGIPRQITENAGNGEDLRLFAQNNLASLSVRIPNFEGFSTIFARTVTTTTLSDPVRLTFPGNQCSNAVTLANPDDSLLAVYRDEITSTPSMFHVNVDRLDPALNVSHGPVYPLDTFHNPQQITAAGDGYLIHVTDIGDVRDLVHLDSTGSIVSDPVPIGGADLVSLVESTPADRPMLTRAAAGAVELIPLDIDGQPQTSTLAATGRGMIDALAARATTRSTLVLWQATTVELVRIRNGVTPPEPSSIPINGTNVLARAIAQDAGGVVVFAERDAADGEREIVAVQVCGL